jgi:GTP-binding protein EngB required for normal cell division
MLHLPSFKMELALMKPIDSKWETEGQVDSQLRYGSPGEDKERTSLPEATPAPSPDLSSLLHSGIQALGKHELRLHSSVERLIELEDRLAKGRFHLAFLGQFKRGKSTLLNALIGEEIAPCSVIPLTSIPTLVRYSESKQVSITYIDGHSHAIAPGEIADFVTEERNPHNRKKVRQVEVGHPAPLLSQGIVLIDTPGIGSTFTHNSQTTLEFLPHCDAALFLISPDPPITEAEVIFLRTVRKQLDHFFFVLNKADTLDHNERGQLIEFFYKVLREQIGVDNPISLFTVSARQGLQARLAKDDSLWRSSGMAEIERFLINFSAREKTEVLHRAVTKRARDIGFEVNLQIDLERRSLEIPLEDLDQRIDIFDRKIDEISKQRQSAADILVGDQRRTSRFIEERADSVHEQVTSQIKSWMQDFFSKHQGRMEFDEMETQFHQQIEKSFPEMFREQAGLFFAELRQRLQQALGNQISRSNSLFEEVQKTAAEIFHISYHPIDLDAGLPQLKDVFWETSAPSIMLGTISLQAFQEFMPRRMRFRRVEKRLQEEADRLIGHNVENLRWNAIRQVDDAFRLLTREIDLRFQALIEGTRGALQAASESRKKNADSVQEEMAKLRKFGESMRVWTEQLEALLSKETHP